MFRDMLFFDWAKKKKKKNPKITKTLINFVKFEI